MSKTFSSLSRIHLESMRDHYDNTAGQPLLWAAECYRNWLAHYYNLLIPPNARILEIGCGSGDLLARLHVTEVTGIDLSEKHIEQARKRLPHGTFHVQAGEELNLDGSFDYIIISDTLNLAADVQALLERLHRVATPDTRLLLNFPSSLWRPFYSIATLVGWRACQPQSNWLAPADVKNLLYLTDWEVVKVEPRILMPCEVAYIDQVLNRWLAPLLSCFCLAVFTVARPSSRMRKPDIKTSVIIPARNEAGNIENAVRRMPQLGMGTEIIFVEGHSHDQTWEEIQRVKAAYPTHDIKIFRQTGRGKGDAVRLGFAKATGDVLMILDADLTVPPEDLEKFYTALASGHGEFINGVRLVYPMGKEAMRFLNLCANKFFSIAFSWLLGQNVKDTLCGTKAMSREHYNLLAANRAYFGEFDPFGDFDLLFGADKLNLKIVDIPIRYQDRTYGETNIRRFRDGLLLFRMMAFAARKIKFV